MSILLGRERPCSWAFRPFLLILALATVSAFAPTRPAQKIRHRNQNVISPCSLHAKRGGKGKSGGGGKSKGGIPDRLVEETLYIECESDGSDAWRCADITDILRRGGVEVFRRGTVLARPHTTLATPLRGPGFLTLLYTGLGNRAGLFFPAIDRLGVH